MSNLDSVNFKEMMKDKRSPFAKKEKLVTVRVSESTYDYVRTRAFKNKSKIVREIDKLVKEGRKYEEEHGLSKD